MNYKGREKLDHRVGPTGFKVNTQLLNLNKKDMLHEAIPSDLHSSCTFYHTCYLQSSIPVLCWCLNVAQLDPFLRNHIGTVCTYKHVLCVEVFEVLAAAFWYVTP